MSPVAYDYTCRYRFVSYKNLTVRPRKKHAIVAPRGQSRINHLSHSDTCEISRAHAAIFLGNIWSDRSPWPRQPLPPWPQLQIAPSAVMARLWS